jgi:hypothetical protein
MGEGVNDFFDPNEIGYGSGYGPRRSEKGLVGTVVAFAIPWVFVILYALFAYGRGIMH